MFIFALVATKLILVSVLVYSIESIDSEPHSLPVPPSILPPSLHPTPRVDASLPFSFPSRHASVESSMVRGAWMCESGSGAMRGGMLVEM